MELDFAGAGHLFRRSSAGTLALERLQRGESLQFSAIPIAELFLRQRHQIWWQEERSEFPLRLMGC